MYWELFGAVWRSDNSLQKNTLEDYEERQWVKTDSKEKVLEITVLSESVINF